MLGVALDSTSRLVYAALTMTRHAEVTAAGSPRSAETCQQTTTSPVTALRGTANASAQADSASGYNKQGRSVSDSMRLREFKKYVATLPTPNPFKEYEYRGFKISGTVGKRWYVIAMNASAKTWPTSYGSRSLAEAAVDTCLALREELSK